MSIITLPRKIYQQRDIIDSLKETLQLKEPILLVSDRNIMRIFGDRIRNALQGSDYRTIDDVTPEPEISAIELAYKNLSGFQPRTIIALGGGSVIDFAKSLDIKISYPERSLEEVNPFEPLDLRAEIIAIPTTSGTGSDVSFGIVLANQGRKLALGNFDLVPYVSVLDSSLVPSDPKIIRPTGVDALVHSFEALTANTSSIFTDAMAEKAIETIFKNIEGSMNGNEDARENMHLAATMAGIAFTNSGTALAHALGHSFGATHHVVHGTCVGLFLPYVIEFNSSDTNAKMKYDRIAERLGYKDAISALKDLYGRIGQPTTAKELGIQRDVYMRSIDEMVEKALADSELAFNPVIAGDEDVRSIFLKAYGD
ncbi:iron-containing alcohol dehydrogenase family protein [Thermoplasma sp.]|uniref:iron-containing alcohol dehydrogenase family protein n=1 Tax=Thermoplasma sp. TaxID=1973142 RepID=UPI001273213A|nr:iron-containing alcohol dehydrogenase family protein [Thermoplasma sp.]KAA8923084.1 MAG: iron-containing alcohol dehydrogenase [Thermoplasma sp.]